MTSFDAAPEYVAARIVLLDALDALSDHLDAVIVVGAQAVYLRTGQAGLRSSPYTTDGDLAFDVTILADEPALGARMEAAGFALKSGSGLTNVQPGQWIRSVDVAGRTFEPQVDLIVPRDTLPGGRSRRGARLPGLHGRQAAMRTHGLEAAIVDKSPLLIAGLAQDDRRRITVNVAGVAALLIAKLHKIGDRVDDVSRPDRQADKDAADVYRLVRATPATEMAARIRSIQRDEMASPTVDEALIRLPRLFGRPRSAGVEMAIRSVATDVAAETVTAQLTAYTAELERRLSQAPS